MTTQTINPDITGGSSPRTFDLDHVDGRAMQLEVALANWQLERLRVLDTYKSFKTPNGVEDLSQWFDPSRINDCLTELFETVNPNFIERYIYEIRDELIKGNFHPNISRPSQIMAQVIPSIKNVHETKEARARFKFQNYISGEQEAMAGMHNSLPTFTPLFVAQYYDWMNGTGRGLENSQRDLFSKVRFASKLFFNGSLIINEKDRIEFFDAIKSTQPFVIEQLMLILLSPTKYRDVYLKAFLARFVFDNLSQNIEIESGNNRIESMIKIIELSIKSLKEVLSYNPPQAVVES